MTEIRTAAVQVPNGNLLIDAYLAEPLGVQTVPAVIVIQEVFGVNAHIRAVTDRLAQAGYGAIAPAIFQRTAPGFEVGYSAEALALGRFHKDQTTAEELLSDLQATIAYLQHLPWVQAQALGIIGFCFGGHVAYLGATLPQIRAAAVFYGGGIAVMSPGGGPPTVSRTSEITGTVYGFFGTRDPLIANEQVDQIAAALQAAGVEHRLFRYDAGHGFFCDQRSDYHPAAAADAWHHVMELFGRLQG
jgi:carboxymethylenebutenolidase